MKYTIQRVIWYSVEALSISSAVSKIKDREINLVDIISDDIMIIEEMEDGMEDNTEEDIKKACFNDFYCT